MSYINLFLFKKKLLREFTGFAGDNEFKLEARKLRDTLEELKLDSNPDKIICISYDPPYKLFGRRNEILVVR